MEVLIVLLIGITQYSLVDCGSFMNVFNLNNNI